MVAKITTDATGFPFEVMGGELSENFKELANQYSIPADFLGTTAIFTIAALAGNMYTTELNGSIKNIIYAMLVGPSGLGKSPAYNILIGDIVKQKEKELFERFETSIKEWFAKKEDAKNSKQVFNETKPRRRIRTASGGTVEGIMKHAMYTHAGFGLYYDEGGKMLGSPNAYKKENSSVDFWNEMWNGNPYNDLRADDERERFINATSISVICGMQSDRVSNHFNKDSFDSGLPARFIITSSDYIPLNENVNHFSQKRRPCDGWIDRVEYLFNRGAYNYFSDDQAYNIPFAEGTPELYNAKSQQFVKESNANRLSIKAGDVSSLMITYDVKLYAYFGRFMVILAIMEDVRYPVIKEHHILGAEKLYRYYRRQAERLFTNMMSQQLTDLNENERLLLDELPDNFETKDAYEICDKLKFTHEYFNMTFKRKYSQGYIKKVKRGYYEKEF
jgi:hypothetical protein